MVETVETEVAAKPMASSQSQMISWADWWEQWGDEVVNDPNEFAGIEPLYRKI